MGISKRPPVCAFCLREDVRLVRLMSDRLDYSPGGYPRRLCPVHYEILDQAGARGRVHAGSGVRWWMAEHRPRPGA